LDVLIEGWTGLETGAPVKLERGDVIVYSASEVGYDSEAAFGRAFTKATGVAPTARRGTAT
jgi:AraC-like DNA-binding protein